MAVVQISRIQHRRGKKDDLPKPNLAEGEIGFATDTGDLYIGAPNFPWTTARTNNHPFRNLQILTELTPLSTATAVEYRFDVGGSPTATEAWTVERELQNRLDDIISVRDYGAVGDRIVDDTDAFVQALIDVNQERLVNNANGRLRALRIPTGIYRITRPLPLPPGVILVGEGNTPIKTVSGTPTVVASSTVIEADFSEGSFDPFDSVFVTADSTTLDTAQNDISNFDPSRRNLGPNLPNDIYVMGLTIKATNYAGRTNPGIQLVRLDKAHNVGFYRVRFEGEYVCSTQQIVNANGANTYTFSNQNLNKIYDTNTEDLAVMIDSAQSGIASHKPSDIWFEECVFTNLRRAFVPTDDVQNVTVNNSIFQNMFLAVSIGEQQRTLFSGSANLTDQTTSGVAPRGIRVTNSRFNNINSHGFAVFCNETGDKLSGTGHISMNNRYDNVGHNCATGVDSTTAPQVAAIWFKEGSKYNQSLGDMFLYDGANDQLRIAFSAADINVINDPQIYFNAQPVETQATNCVVLSDAAGANSPTNITFDPSLNNIIELDYSIKRGTETRRGEILISASTDGSTLDWTDRYSETADPGFDIQVLIDSGNITIQYEDTSPTSEDGLFCYNAKVWLSTTGELTAPTPPANP